MGRVPVLRTNSSIFLYHRRRKNCLEIKKGMESYYISIMSTVCRSTVMQPVLKVTLTYLLSILTQRRLLLFTSSPPKKNVTLKDFPFFFQLFLYPFFFLIFSKLLVLQVSENQVKGLPQVTFTSDLIFVFSVFFFFMSR